MYKLISLVSIVVIISISSTNAANPVKVSVYYESLCPYSKQFIVEQLIPTHDKVSAIIDVDLSPFGNAKWKRVDRPDGTFDVEFTCQHGEQECIGNRIHDCVLSTDPIDKTLAFDGCIFQAPDWKTPASAGKTCSEQLKHNWTAINDCATGPLGRGLLLLHGERHSTTSPKPTYVPWIAINGVHNDALQEQAQGNLLKLVCDTYEGQKPAQCNSV